MPQATSSLADSLSMTQSMMEDGEGRSIKCVERSFLLWFFWSFRSSYLFCLTWRLSSGHTEVLIIPFCFYLIVVSCPLLVFFSPVFIPGGSWRITSQPRCFFPLSYCSLLHLLNGLALTSRRLFFGFCSFVSPSTSLF